MIELYVNDIIDLEEGLQGYVFDIELILKNVQSVFSENDNHLIRKTVLETGGIKLFNVYGQLIVFLGIKKDKTGMMIFIDCKNNQDNALDLFNEMKKHGIDERDRTMFMNQFMRLQDEYDEVEINYELVLV